MKTLLSEYNSIFTFCPDYKINNIVLFFLLRNFTCMSALITARGGNLSRKNEDLLLASGCHHVSGLALAGPGLRDLQ